MALLQSPFHLSYGLAGSEARLYRDKVHTPGPTVVADHAPDARQRVRGDAIAMLGAIIFLIILVAIGQLLILNGFVLNVPTPPLFAYLRPHVGPGTLPALLLGVLGIRWARSLSDRLPWPRLMARGWMTAFAWTASLALVDGWRRGWAGPLEGGHEYLSVLPHITDVTQLLAGFSARIVDFQPDSWPTHVAGHPPAATLVFWLLDRAGLSGGGWAGALVIVIGSTTAITVPMIVRWLGAPDAARRLVPLMIFLPGAVWVGVSADGLFAGIAALGLALAVRGATSRRRSWPLLAVMGGLLLGLVLYLSYGLVLYGLIVLGAAGLTMLRNGADRRETLGRWVVVAAGTLLLAGAFTAAGFRWWEGLALVQIRYQQGVASHRPYAYFVWANLATLVLSTGAGAAAGIVRALTVVRDRWRDRTTAIDAERLVPAVLTLTAAAAIAVADISGLSKAETERIWLPFVVVLATGMSLLPPRAAQWALTTGIISALLVNHLLRTHW